MAVPTQFAYRTLKGIGIVDAAPVYEPLPGFQKPEGNLRCCTYSPCGRYFAWASQTEVLVIDASVGFPIASLPAENVYELGFSPLGTHIITWQRPSKDENGDSSKNLKVWKTVENDETTDQERVAVGKFVQKSQTGWNLQYTSDEQFCARVVTNEVQFYKSGDLGTVWNKLRVEGVKDFAISPGKTHSVAVFIPEHKGQPAAVKVFNVPQFESPLSQKTFFKGDKVQLKWNSLGTSLIVLAQTEVDKTGKSYYGETTLYILSANGGFDSRIQLDREGPIYDVSWSPNSKEFGVVYGQMPAKTTIFNVRAAAKHSFPLGPRNTISFSPHGRFVLVAGFGNLAGQIDIYDLEKDYQKVTTIEGGNPSVCNWSPDGTCILTATTSPRLRVDNGVRIWHVGGGLMYNEDMVELYHVTWRPQSPTTHPLPANPLSSVPKPHSSALAYLGTVKTPSKPVGAYRPPGARGQVTPLHFKREDEGGAAHINNGVSSFAANINGMGRKKKDVPGSEPVASEPLPPGAAPGGGVSLTPAPDSDEQLSKVALKNKKRREAKKMREAEKAASISMPDAALEPIQGADRRVRSHSRTRSKGNVENGTRSRNRSNNEPAATGGGSHVTSAVPVPVVPEMTETPIALSPDSNSQGSSHDKKIRGLLKKMRAIDDLKMRLAGGEKLEDTQMKKIATEEGVRGELEGLGWSG